ncbi:MAG: mannosyltransferase family protein [Candidatus Alcyoniella australis]|nr:mannosyltransferase family protein [Candidatus Alcyoniella australis]
MRRILGGFAITRLYLLLVLIIAAAYVPFHRANYDANFRVRADSAPILDSWARWDGQWYQYISVNGYDTSQLGPFQQTATACFFPLYPLLMRGVNLVISEPIISGMLVSNLCLLLFLMVLMRLEQRTTAEDRERAVWYYLIFPTSFFLSAVYSESLFLLLSAGAFLAAQRGRWWLACLLAGISTACRPVGVLLGPPLLLLYLQQIEFSPRRLRLDLLAFILVPLGVALYALHCKQMFGDPLAFVQCQDIVRYSGGEPWTAFVRFFEQAPAWRGFHNAWPDFFCAVLALLALPFIFLRLGAAQGIYASLLVLIPLCSSLISFQRMILVSFPHLLLLGQLGGNRWVDRIAVLLGAGMLAFNFAAFSHWFWVA